MVTARQLLAGFLLCNAAACSDQAKAAAEAEDMTPVAKAMTIYSAGGSVVSGVVDSSTLGSRRLRLPGSVARWRISESSAHPLIAHCAYVSPHSPIR